MDTNATQWQNGIDWRPAGVKVVFYIIQLTWDRSSRPTLYQNLNAAFQYGRSLKIAFVVRFYYQNTEAPFSTIQLDVPEIANVLKAYPDVIYAVEAGFLGAGWGEWWGTDSTPDYDIGTNSTVKIRKTFVVDTLLTTGIPVNLRTPTNVVNYYNKNRMVGFHDDCILAEGPNGSDMGTFDKASAKWPANSISIARSYAATNITGPKGGEICMDTYVASCQAILDYVKKYKLSYLNMAWPTYVNRIFNSNTACSKSIGTALAANTWK